MKVEIGNIYEFSMPFGKNIVARVIEDLGGKSLKVEHIKGKAPYKGCKEYCMMHNEVVRSI